MLNAVTKMHPVLVVRVMTLPTPPEYFEARSLVPDPTEPTARPPRLMSFARPRVCPAGSGSWDTTPACQMSGSGLDPNDVVVPVPTTVPALFTPLPAAKLRAG